MAKHRSWLSVLLLASLWLAGVTVAQAAETLTILHTNDVHSHLLPFDSSADGKDIGGVARRRVLFNQERAQHPNILVIDAGDSFQGTPLYTFFHGEVEMKAMDMLGYDASILGNHDLDNGLDNLKKQLQYVHFPFLCANVLGADGKPVFKPWTMVTRGHAHIALVGLIGLPAWDVIAEKNKVGLQFIDPRVVLKDLVPQLRTVQKADLVVVMTHQGWHEDQEMAKETPGVDILIGAHSHTRPPGDKAVLVPNGTDNGIGGTIVVQAYWAGILVGDLDLTVDGHRITQWSWQLMPVDARYNPPADDALAKLVNGYNAQIATRMSEVIGDSSALMTNKGSYEGEIALGDMVADILRDESHANVAVINSGGLREELPAGPITVGRIFSILPFDNELVTMKMKGRDLLAVAQRIAGHLGKSGFMQESGLAFRIEQGKAEDVRVAVVPATTAMPTYEPVDPNKSYTVASIDFLLGLKQGPEANYFAGASDIQESEEYVRDIVTEYIRRHKHIQPAPLDRMLIVK